MNIESLEERVERWGMDLTPQFDGAFDFLSLYSLIEFLAFKRFGDYHPTIGPSSDFLTRLSKWVDNLSDESDQKLLIRLIPSIFFIGPKEFFSLYRFAMNGVIQRWLIELLGIDLCTAAFTNSVANSLSESWICPITDSMQIAEFCHVNSLSGTDYRPDWRSLAKFSNTSTIANFMQSNRLKRLILLEDFVGSGSQMSDAIEFAIRLPNKPDILLAPLVIAPAGVLKGRVLASSYNNVTFKPILQLDKEVFVPHNPSSEDSLFMIKVRELLNRIYPIVTNGITDESQIPYGPFGYRKTGGLLVMHTNCPDNTLPIVHHASATWTPLFPRSSRV